MTARPRFTFHLSLFTLLATTSAAAAAHDGHGPTGTHWHATDLWGFVALGVVAAAIAWHQPKK